MKKCNCCGLTKELNEFYKNRGSCISCVKIKLAKYRKINADKIKEYKDAVRVTVNEKYRKDYKENPEKYKAKKQKYIINNKEKFLEQGRLQYKKHKEKANLLSKKYYEKYKESILEYRRNYKKINKVRVKAKKTELHKNKLINDPYYRLVYNIRSLIRTSIKEYSLYGKKLTCKEYGINFKEIYTKLGPKPAVDYHLDHIIPISKFNLDNKEHVKLAHLPCNLRWLSSTENIQKRDKIIIELFTPELFEIAKIIGLELFPVKD